MSRKQQIRTGSVHADQNQHSFDKRVVLCRSRNAGRVALGQPGDGDAEGDEETKLEGGVTTTIGFGGGASSAFGATATVNNAFGSSATTASAMAATAPTMMIVKKKKKKPQSTADEPAKRLKTN